MKVREKMQTHEANMYRRALVNCARKLVAERGYVTRGTTDASPLTLVLWYVRNPDGSTTTRPIPEATQKKIEGRVATVIRFPDNGKLPADHPGFYIVEPNTKGRA